MGTEAGTDAERLRLQDQDCRERRICSEDSQLEAREMSPARALLRPPQPPRRHTRLHMKMMSRTMAPSRSPSVLSSHARGASTHAADSCVWPWTGGGARMMSASASPLAEKITAHIESADVVVFSKSWCPFCMQTKGLFETLQVPVTYIELDELADGADMQMELAQMSGQRTVPNVFIKGTHLGGNDDTQRAARSGKLQELLATSKL